MERHHEAAQLLLGARRRPSAALEHLPEGARPLVVEHAYLIQRAIMRELGEIGGWKVGSPSPTGDFTCAPLPSRGVLTSPATADCSERGVEAEIAVRMGRSLPTREQPYSAEEVLAALDTAHPAIEVVQSRFADPAVVDPLSKLADSLSHFSLVVGPAIPRWHAVDLAKESVRVLVDGAEFKRGTGNPAGDMLRLLVWLANTGARWAGGLRAGQIVTTGSWTGKDDMPAGSEVRIVFDHCGEAVVRFAP